MFSSCLSHWFSLSFLIQASIAKLLVLSAPPFPHPDRDYGKFGIAHEARIVHHQEPTSYGEAGEGVEGRGHDMIDLKVDLETYQGRFADTARAKNNKLVFTHDMTRRGTVEEASRKPKVQVKILK